MPKTYVHTKRGKTMQYNASNLLKAVEVVQSGSMSIRKASEAFGIPKSTIADRISGKHSIDVTHGRPPALPASVENKIVTSVKLASQLGIGLSRKQILLRTNVLCKRIKLQSTYRNFHAGKDWWEGVRKRHPELVIRTPEKLSTVRSRMLNPEVIGKYFDDLGQLLSNLNLVEQPHRIWNADETGFNFEHSPVRVVAEKGDRRVVSKTTNRSTNLTAMACVNATGQQMPPLLITKGKTQRSLHSFNTTASPSGTVWTYQKNGWITDDIGELWFDNIFLKYCGPERPQLLIIDGHSSHESLAIIERAIEEDITLLTLPPHSTHYLQPLDRTVFGPLKRAYNEACSAFMQEHPLHLVNKWTFPALLKEAWTNSLTESNITAGFRACGIVPFNRNAVPSTAFLPSRPTDVSDISSQIVCASSTIISPTCSNSTMTMGSLEDVPSFVAQKVACLSHDSPQADQSVVRTDSNIDSCDVDAGVPVLDISDPSQLMDFITSGDAVIQDLDSSFLFNDIVQLDNCLNDENSPPRLYGVSANESSVGQCVDELFTPKIATSRPATKAKKVSGHKLLTSLEVLEEKKLLQTQKMEKILKSQMKQNSKRLKKEKMNKVKAEHESNGRAVKGRKKSTNAQSCQEASAGAY